MAEAEKQDINEIIKQNIVFENPELEPGRILNLNGLREEAKYAVAKEAINMIKENPELLNRLLDNAPKDLFRYSERNRLLILMQNPKATELKGFKEWEKLGKKPTGSKTGIFYLAPITEKNKEENEEEEEATKATGFIWVHGFDISDVKEIQEEGEQVEK